MQVEAMIEGSHNIHNNIENKRQLKHHLQIKDVCICGNEATHHVSLMLI
jgi:hypothetical protein